MIKAEMLTARPAKFNREYVLFFLIFLKAILNRSLRDKVFL